MTGQRFCLETRLVGLRQSLASMNTASIFWTASKAIGEITGEVLPRAVDAMSASSENFRLAWAQHAASMIGPGFRSGL
jgi:hypothetical protein